MLIINHLDVSIIIMYSERMRTTLTLDDRLLQTLKRKAAEKKVPFKTIVHQALQLGLEAMESSNKPVTRFRTPTRSLKQRQGYDLDKLGQVADEMEDEEKTTGKPTESG
jgi:hypothetical protein